MRFRLIAKEWILRGERSQLSKPTVGEQHCYETILAIFLRIESVRSKMVLMWPIIENRKVKPRNDEGQKPIIRRECLLTLDERNIT